MPDRTLTPDTLGAIDAGNAGLLIQTELDRAAADLDQRGEDYKVRKVVIQVEMSVDKKSDEKKIVVKAQAKLPPRETREVPASTRRHQGVARLLFDDVEGEAEGADDGDAA